jgi:DNA-binding FrmR family transcriptional regulator
MLSAEKRQELVRRLRKIEGQTQGIQKMLAENRDCREILNQLSSVRAATRRVSLELTKSYITACVNNPDCLDSEEAVGEIISIVLRV